jgi:MFS transporter, PPP family, 3-phenylpropionic acid transporter
MANQVRLLYFFSFCCQAAWLPRFADFLKNEGFSAFESGVLLSVQPVLMFLVQPIYGILADKIGYKKTLVSGALLAALFFLGFLWKGGFFFIGFVMFGMAIFYNATQPIIDSLALQAVERDPKFSYGGLRIAGAVAWSAMGLVNGFLVENFDIRAIFWVASAAMGLTFLLALMMPISAKTVEKTANSPENRGNFVGKDLLSLLIIVGIVSVAHTAIWNFYSLFMNSIGATDVQTGMGFTLQGLCELPFFYFSVKIIGRFGLRKTLILTLVVTILRLILYSLVKNPSIALGIELLHGISWSLFWVVCVELTDLAVPNDRKATGQSLLYASYFGIGAVLGNFWTTFLSEKFGLAQVFQMNAWILAAVVAFIFIRKNNFK